MDYIGVIGMFALKGIHKLGKLIEKRLKIKNHTVLVFLYLIEVDKTEVEFQLLIKDLEISPVNVTRAIQHLLGEDFVEFMIDPNDTRKKIVRLTDKGKAFKLDLIEEFKKIGGN
tara:strand:- start:111 stop:452 length:342 start_codon:yes stop_codon:yes gene_type:complete